MNDTSTIGKIINRLKGMSEWSDRIGSDEISEIREIIKILEEHIKKEKK